MPSIKIEIISVKVATNPGKKAGTTYQSLDVAFRNLTFQNKVEGRKIMSFGATAGTFATLSNAASGDVFDVDVVKNAQGFNDWVSAKKSDAGGQDTSTGGTTPANGRSTGSYATGSTVDNASPKSTYETPEERAKKQIYIVRQSSVGSAIELLSLGAKSPPKIDEVVGLAKQIEAYVFGDVINDAASKADVSDIDDDILL